MTMLAVETPPQNTGRPEATQDVLANNLNMYPVVGHDELSRGPDGVSWQVSMIDDRGQVGAVPAPDGLLIRFTDNHDEESYTFIEDGSRWMFDRSRREYPEVVARRLLAVRNHRVANGHAYEDPLGLAMPAGMPTILDAPTPEVADAYVGRRRNEHGITDWFKQTRLGKFITSKLVKRPGAAPTEEGPAPADAAVAEPVAAEPAAFQPVIAKGEPLPQRGTVAADTAAEPRAAAAPHATASIGDQIVFVHASTTTAEAQPGQRKSGLTRLAAGLGLGTVSTRNAAAAPVVPASQEMTPAQRRQADLDEALSAVGAKLDLKDGRMPSAYAIRTRADAAAAARTVLNEYRHRAANGDFNAANKVVVFTRYLFG